MKKRNAFSLIELSITLVISGLMLGFVLQSKQSATSTECLVATRNKVQDIGGAIKRFARKNDRLPMPAARNIGVEDVNYGREALAANITQSGGVSFGAVPFQALGLPVDYASDCWNNKLTYMVTTALTTNSSSGGYLDATVSGTIALKNTTTLTTNTITAYAILSHGEDQLGAVKNNYSGAGNGWCTGASTLITMNCRATDAEVASGAFNNGKDAGTNYFDDIILAASKPQILSSPSTVYGWGHNGSGQLGNGTSTDSLVPTMVTGGITFNRITTGSTHACGLTTAGVAYCWGGNGGGRLGDGTTTNKSVPTLVSGGLTFKSISAGMGNTCGITTAGAAYCWGNNINGQLGDNTLVSKTVPTLVSGGHTFNSISVSHSHAYTCGITTTGKAYCWGKNDLGQLGDTTTTDRKVPKAVSGGLTFASIATGGYGAIGVPTHTCGITTAGAAYCWGSNGFGQLGDTTTTNRKIPTAVSGGITFASIAAGNGHSCGIATNNKAYCWGWGINGQLGDSTLVSKLVPTLVSGGHTFTSISASDKYSCGITTTDKVYCWGNNNYGQFGDGSTTDSSVPTPVSGGMSFAHISITARSVMAIKFPEKAYGWGWDVSNQLGNDDWMGTDKTAPTLTVGGISFTSTSAGNLHSCGLTAAGTAYCWGSTQYGQMGIGVTSGTGYPTTNNAVSGGLVFASIDAGYDHTCGLTTAGAAYCWGYNNVNQLGDTTTTTRNVPTAVSGGLTFVKIVAGDYHGCGLTAAGAAYCWGYNGYGQLGDASTTNRNAPTAVSGGLTFTTLDAGGYHTCGLTTTGAAYCWGFNSAGQVGDNTLVNKNVPTIVSGGKIFRHIATGSLHSCGLTAAGAAYCWGYNGYGQLGDTTTTAQKVPKAVSGGLLFNSLAVGESHNCALDMRDQAYCWGANLSGGIGDGTTTRRKTPTAVSGGLYFGRISVGHEDSFGIAY